VLLYINHFTGLSSDGVSVSVSTDTTTFTLTLSITFKGTFVGVQNVYGQVTADNGAASPYFTMGTWQVFAASSDPPTLAGDLLGERLAIHRQPGVVGEQGRERAGFLRGDVQPRAQPGLADQRCRRQLAHRPAGLSRH
jgi:hypothetical protein